MSLEIVRGLVAALVGVAICVSVARGQDASAAVSLPLHERIDRLVEAAHDGPPAMLCTDVEFVRRAFLDLVGRIPAAADVRAFVHDPATNKRPALVDRLIESPDFARRLAIVLDVALVERRLQSQITPAEWRQYLFASTLANKPYDEVAREILSADGVDPAMRPAAKFNLERDAEPNGLTRDVGRMFLGIDLQCAQCHDHPLIDDYKQRDYYGIFAFFNRTFVFTDKEKKQMLAEKGEGGVDFQSVFDPTQKGNTGPRLPGAAAIEEPTFTKGEEYEVKPEKDVRPVPKYSRRAQFARHAAAGASRAFNRNLANRLWAMLLGQGLVDPVDLMHSGNPPTHPELLELLTDEVVVLKFDVRRMLRELALTRTYQRSIELPALVAPQGLEVAARLPQYDAESQRLAGIAEQSKAAVAQAETACFEARKGAIQAAEELAKAEAALAAVKKEAEPAAAGLAAAQAELAAKQSITQTLAEAAAKALEAAGKLPDDKELAAAAEKIKARSDQAASEIAAIAQRVGDQQAAVKMMDEKLAAAQQPVSAAAARADAARQQSAALAEQAEIAAARQQVDRAAALQMAGRRDAAKALVDYSKASVTVSQPDAALAQLEAQLVKHWNRRFAVAALKPLSPEQLAWSTMQAVGLVDQQRAAAEAEWTKQHPMPEPGQDAAALQIAKARQAEQFVYEKLGPNEATFVALFAAAPGQPQHEFSATADQALFFANGGAIRGWLVPGGGNLTERAAALADPKAVAEEIYLNTLSRWPAEREASEVASYLAARPNDRPAALQEIIWGLLTSAEFRFNH